MYTTTIYMELIRKKGQGLNRNTTRGSCTNHVATKGEGLKISQNWLRYRCKSGYVRGEGSKTEKNGYVV